MVIVLRDMAYWPADNQLHFVHALEEDANAAWGFEGLDGLEGGSPNL